MKLFCWIIDDKSENAFRANGDAVGDLKDEIMKKKYDIRF
jgi:hypothetical protein